MGLGFKPSAPALSPKARHGKPWQKGLLCPAQATSDAHKQSQPGSFGCRVSGSFMDRFEGKPLGVHCSGFFGGVSILRFGLGGQDCLEGQRGF